MIWQRWARLFVAAIGIGCAVALFAYTRSRPPKPAPPPQVAVDPQATMQSGAGRLVRYRGNQEVGVIDYTSTKTYADDRMVFENPHIVSSDERGFEAWALRSETKGKSVHADNPGEMEFTGHVRVKTKDGLELHTESATYDDDTGGVRIPGALTFTRERMTGRGVGATYDRLQDVLTVLDQAHVDVAPEPDGKGAMSASSKSMTLDRLHKFSRLEQGATMTHDAETLNGDTATLYYTEDEKHLRLIELRGHASVTQAANAGAGSPPDMHADDIDMGFHPDGHTLHVAALTGRSAPAKVELIDQTGRRAVSGDAVNLMVAPDGSTLTSLDSKGHARVELPKTPDNPKRTITAPTLAAQGNDKEGLKQATFEGGAEFTEIVPGEKGAKDSVRTGKSKTLVLALNGQIDAIDRAVFRGDATFSDADVRGDADEATYFEADGKLQLRSAARGPKKAPQVTDGGLQVNALWIDVNVNTNDLDAGEGVTTVNRPSPDAPPQPQQRTSALFDFNDPNRPIYGSSDKLHYTSETGRAVYTGAGGKLAQARQDQNLVVGDEVAMETSTHNLKATGHVSSKYMLTPAPDPNAPAGSPPPKPTLYHGTSDSLDYRDADGVAVYIGAPAVLDSVDGTTAAPRIEVTFNDQGNSVDRLDASGGAYAQLEGGREAVGERLVYTSANDTYVLTGTAKFPARVKLPNNDHTQCTKSVGEKLTFTRQSGSADGALHSENLASCAVSIKDPVK